MDMLPPIYLICQNIRSRHNVGSIFRSADAFAVTKIYLCGYTPYPPHPDISKTALGAEKTVPWEHRRQTWRVIKELQSRGVIVLALEKPNSNKFQSKPLLQIIDDRLLSVTASTVEIIKKKGVAVILGNEVNGVTPKILKLADHIAYIPMYGKKESLNVSVAAGIALYALRTMC